MDQMLQATRQKAVKDVVHLEMMVEKETNLLKDNIKELTEQFNEHKNDSGG